MSELMEKVWEAYWEEGGGTEDALKRVVDVVQKWPATSSTGDGMTQTHTLKPCPFCGKDNVKTFGPVGWYRQWGISHSCPSFYNGTSEMMQGFNTEDAAIQAWNRRDSLGATLMSQTPEDGMTEEHNPSPQLNVKGPDDSQSYPQSVALSDLDDARKWLRARWCVEHPNEGHVKQLAEYAESLRTPSPQPRTDVKPINPT